MTGEYKIDSAINRGIDYQLWMSAAFANEKAHLEKWAFNDKKKGGVILKMDGAKR